MCGWTSIYSATKAWKDIEQTQGEGYFSHISWDKEDGKQNSGYLEMGLGRLMGKGH